jgi:transglutaminase/protease-like cytokinesis protein 3
METKLKKLEQIPKDYPDRRLSIESASMNERQRELLNHMVQRFVTFIPEVLDDASKVALIHDVLTQNITYKLSDKNPLQYTVTGILIQKSGVCMGIAQTYHILLNAVDIPNKVVIGYGSKELHAWNQVKIDQYWYHVDVTWNLSRSYTDGIYFLKSDSFMKEHSHTWLNQYESCPFDYPLKINLNKKGVDLLCRTFLKVTSLK